MTHLKQVLMFLTTLVILFASNSYADHSSPKKISVHAPIGVMGDHTHKQGEWMLSYRYMHMDMNDNYEGSNSISRQDIFDQDYMVAPLDMSMEMHMLGIMYAPTDKLTLMAMLPYVRKSMDHVTRPMMMQNNMMDNMDDDMGNMIMGARKFTTQSSGIGDITLSALYSIYQSDSHYLHLTIGVSVPTGSIDERDDTAMQTNAKLPYPMQIGSGTYDLLPGITYTGHTTSGPQYSWGAQANAIIRLGTNDNSYRLGNRYELTSWFAKHWSHWFNTSIRLAGSHWDDIHGEDNDLRNAINMVPTADPDNHGGDRIDAALGLNFHLQEGIMSNHRFALEFGMPVYQYLAGPQMATNWNVTVGWQLSF